MSDLVEDNREQSETLGLTPREHARLAETLLKAAAERRPVKLLSRRFPEMTVGDARRIRDMLLARRIAGGQRRIAATGAAGPQPMGPSCVDRFGWLTSQMILPTAAVEPERLIRPRVAAKVAFRLCRPLREAVDSVTDLLAATDRVIPVLEVVDSRYGTASPTLADDIADNCGASLLHIGESALAWDRRPPLSLALRLELYRTSSNGRPPTSWRTNFAPINSVLWLARQVIEAGNDLHAGTLLLSSAGAGLVELTNGTGVRARVEGLGTVQLNAYTKHAKEVLA